MKKTPSSKKSLLVLIQFFFLVVGVGWGGSGRLFEFKWEWEGGRMGWALIRGLALIRGWALNRINTIRQKIASERKALVAGWSYTQ